jgi:hypothetical protein
MAKTVATAFKECLDKLDIIELSALAVAKRQAAIAPTLARQLTVIDDFVAGSFARKTMIEPLKKASVDLFLVLTPALYLAAPNGPANLLERVKRCINTSLNQATEASRTAVGITIKYPDFRVDVIPAFMHDAGAMLIPDPNEKKWVQTNPKLHLQMWNKSNADHHGQLVPLIRLAKQWNQHHGGVFRSFHLETLVRDIFMSQPIEDLPHAMLYFFENAASHLRVSDPAGNLDSLADYLDDSYLRQLAISKMFRTGADLARDGLRLEASDNSEQAILKWRGIFGETYFPRYH